MQPRSSASPRLDREPNSLILAFEPLPHQFAHLSERSSLWPRSALPPMHSLCLRSHRARTGRDGFERKLLGPIASVRAVAFLYALVRRGRPGLRLHFGAALPLRALQRLCSGARRVSVTCANSMIWGRTRPRSGALQPARGGAQLCGVGYDRCTDVLSHAV